MVKTYRTIILFIVLTGSLNLFGIDYKLGDYKSFYGNKIDYYDLGAKNFQDNIFWSSRFPTTEEEIDFVNQRVGIITKFNSVEAYPKIYISLDQYFDNLFAYSFDKLLYEKTIEFFGQEEREESSGGLIPDLVFDLPKFARSKTVKRIFGEKAGRLSFSGSERLTISATSTKNDNIALSEGSDASTLTPKMEQKLNMQLKGTIGEKIHVDLKYNSDQEETFFDPNNINISYKGFDDEIVQSVEAGDISLDLSGSSQYVGSISSSQGLFGIRSDLKIGALEITAILSQEEGKKNKMTFESKAQADSSIVNARDYTRRDRYYLINPYELFAFHQEGDVVPGTSTPIPSGWINNAIKLDNNGSLLLIDDQKLPADGSLLVYLDDMNATNNTATVPGFEDVQASSPFTPQFDLLEEGVDYYYDYDSGILTLNKTINRNYTLGVRYTQRNGVSVPLNDQTNDEQVHVKYIRVSNQEFDPTVDPKLPGFENQDLDGDNLPDNRFYTWHYQLRNVYSLNSRNINNEDFSLRVFTNDTADNTNDYFVPAEVDNAGFATLNEYLRLDTNGDGKVDGSDSSVNLTSGLIFYPWLEPFKPLGDTLLYQKENENISSTEYRYKMIVKGKIGTDEITLGQTNILRGSVKVRVNGSPQNENIDYLVDYDFGRITFLTAAGKDPNAKIEIDYEFKSGFGLDKRQLFGIRADYKGIDNFNIGGTVIYRSETVQDERPKIGEENMELFLADIDGSFEVKPRFMTDMIDWIPLIETESESSFKLSGEVAFSAPNIYGNPDGKKKEAYIDDMEGILDQYPLGITRKTWVPASKPVNTLLSKARTHWFNPENIKRRDVYDPSTMDDEEEKEDISILALKIVRPELNHPDTSNRSWGGIMKYVGNQVDFTDKKYIEILVKVDTTYGNGDVNVNLRLDLGDISEDYYTFNEGENFLNTEDGIADGIIDGVLDVRTEDLGLDGVKSGLPGDDPYDNFSDNKNSDGDYLFINGTEGNNSLDTEDLNGNGNLDVLNRYLEYSIPISANNNEFLQSEYRGWKLYRIPINNKNNYNIITNNPAINPSLSKISYARLWFEVDKTVRIKVAELSIVGNRWEERPILQVNEIDSVFVESTVSLDILEANNTSILAGITDNQKDNHYTPPTGTFKKKDGIESFEQALTFSVNNLNEKQIGMLRKTSTQSTNYLLYNKLRFWVYPELNPGNLNTSDSLNVIIRVGSDSTRYYEVKEKIAPIIYDTKMSRNNWIEIEIDFNDLTELKNLGLLNNANADESYTSGNRTYRKKGDVTLSNIKEINLGIEPLPGSTFTGKVYFNDIRVADPYEDTGYKARVSMNTSFADFYTTSLDIVKSSDNFINQPSRNASSITSSQQSTSLNFKNNLRLNKFFNDDWKINMPFTLNYSNTESIPRYKQNSDILRDNLDPIEKEREKSVTEKYDASWNYSKSKTNNPWADYTLGSFSLSANASLTDQITPTAADTTYTWKGTVSYNLNLGNLPRGFKVWNDVKLNLFPSSFDNTFTMDAKNPSKYVLTRTDTLVYWRDDTSSSNINTKIATTANTVTFPIVTGKNKTYLNTTYKLTTTRDLKYENRKKDINIGEETKYNQIMTYSFTPDLFTNIWSFSSNGEVRFNEKRTQKSSVAAVIEEEGIQFKHDGDVNRNLNFNMTLRNSDLLSSLSTSMETKRTARAAASDSKVASSPKDDKAVSTPEDKPKDEDMKDPEVEDKDKIDEIEDKAKTETEEKKQEEMTVKDKKRLRDLQNEENKMMQALNDKLSPEERESFEKEIERVRKEIAELSNEIYIPKRKEEKPDDTYVGDNESPKSSQDRPSFQFGLTDIVTFLSKIDNLDISYSNTYSMNYTNLEDRPTYNFQLSIPYSLDTEYINVKENNNTIDLSSGLSFNRIDTQFGYSLNDKKRWSNTTTQTITTVFPDISVNVNDIQRYIMLQDYLTSSSVGSKFTYQVKEEGEIGFTDPNSQTLTTSFSPLISWRGNWIKNIQTSISYNWSKTETTTNKVSFDYITNVNNQGLNGNINWAFRAVDGFKLPFISKSFVIKNDMTLKTDFSWDKSYTTEKGNAQEIVTKHLVNYSIVPGAAYNFHRNIKGGTDFSYKLTQDKKSNRDIEITSFAIWIEIAF
ncbi:cell surface protein SprA [bacterium]|nr:cell surface protein SprA [bacterium]